jgi:hypothetical protein
MIIIISFQCQAHWVRTTISNDETVGQREKRAQLPKNIDE